MKEITFVLSMLLVCLLALGAVPFALASAKTPNMWIWICPNPAVANAGLPPPGPIDINDWPLDSTWIAALAAMPATIRMRDYVEIGMTEIDLNNQKWPTGCPIHKFYDQTCSRCAKALSFRKAIACLLDRNTIVSTVLMGLGFRMDVPLPPFRSDFADMANYTASGVIYDWNVARAAQILDDAGFVMGPNGIDRIDPFTGTYLTPITFYVRVDDPNRWAAGVLLNAAMLAAGIRTTLLPLPRTVCYKNVMVLYSYHLYTGGWSLSMIPDQYYDLYSSYTYYGPNLGWSQNYPGFCNHEFDSWAVKVKYPETIEAARADAKVVGYLFLKYCAVIPMYCSKAVKAYKTGWTGVVNNGGYGIDNYYSFLNMFNPTDPVIDWGFSNDIEQLNVISSQWLWEWNVLGLIYEGMMGCNPYNLAPTEFWIADSYTVGSWDAHSGGGDPDATVVTFEIKNNVTFHNVTGGLRRSVTTSDIAFSFQFTYDCGPGIAWNYPSLAQFNKTLIVDATHISIYFNKKSAWAVQWAGFLPIINNETWGQLTPGFAVKTYDPTIQDLNFNSVVDIMEDGTGAWMFVAYAPFAFVSLARDNSYYLGSTNIDNRLAEMFHIGAGDVNRDMVTSMSDLAYMVRAAGTNSTHYPHGTGWGMYNPDCDLNSDGYVNVLDIAAVTVNYGKTMG